MQDKPKELWEIFEEKFSDKQAGGIPSYIMPSVRMFLSELELTSHCVYCDLTETSSSVAERTEKMTKHTLECAKRPEVRMLTKLTAANSLIEEARVAFDRIIAFGDSDFDMEVAAKTLSKLEAWKKEKL